jgi:1-deoxy-D-xylulose-5-phosphate reductoisomerase
VLPVYSEHNALFQALAAGRREDVTKVITRRLADRSGLGSKDDIRKATLQAALKHPNWSMGPQGHDRLGNLDEQRPRSIEAYHLFNLKPDEIEVLVHPQSIVHGMVEFRDGSVIAHLGAHDMRIPIAHCLAWPTGSTGRPSGSISRQSAA